MENLQFNWNPDKTHLIVGPPGTGKTTRLMSELDQALQIYDPRRIGFVAFTKRAATEAVTRAAEQFGLTSEQLQHFRTLHSFAFRALGLSSKMVMNVGDWINVARSLGYYISYRGIKEDGSFHGQTKGDRLLFLVNVARIQNKTLEQVHFEWINENLPFYELQLMSETIDAYKHEHGKRDFTDIIKEFTSAGIVPDLDVLFVDEAQDLAPVQWTMVSKLASRSGEVFVAGDDDQAIYKWAGADVQQFINLPVGRTTVLDQSYRVPSKVATCANRIISSVSNRIPKKWKPRFEQGTARFIGDPESLDMGTGSWLLLARNSYLLDSYEQICLRHGYVFESSVNSPVDPDLLATIRRWERIRAGKPVAISDAIQVYDYITPRAGVKYGAKSRLKEADPERIVTLVDLEREFGLITREIWHIALDKIPTDQQQYLLAALKRGEKVDGEARIRINTIHGVKGAQADNVVVYMDMAQRTFREYQESPDDEARVWYVAVTRARQALYVVYPKTPNYYPLDTILRER